VNEQEALLRAFGVKRPEAVLGVAIVTLLGFVTGIVMGWYWEGLAFFAGAFMASVGYLVALMPAKAQRITATAQSSSGTPLFAHRGILDEKS